MGPSHGGLGPITNGPDNFTFHELGGDPMPRVFYATMAQVLPVLLLAPVWESRYLENLPNEERRSRRDDPRDGTRHASGTTAPPVSGQTRISRSVCGCLPPR